MILRAFAFAAALCLSAFASAQPTDTIRFIDLTDEFDAFWQASEGQEPVARVAAFRAEFEPLIPGFYNPDRNQIEPLRWQTHVARELGNYPRQRDGVREVSRRFAELFAPARASFEAEFGAFPATRTVYLIHSLGEMDGGTRGLPGGVALIFGADMIARLHLSHSIQPFFHHELFHIHHGYRFDSCEAVWCGLWSEGLATYVAHRLNPEATDAELLLEVPEPIRGPVDANRAEAVCLVRSHLDATDRETMRALYSFSRMNERLPPRFGYYIGYLVAAELGKTRSLQELAELSNADVRPLIETALESLSPCPAA